MWSPDGQPLLLLSVLLWDVRCWCACACACWPNAVREEVSKESCGAGEGDMRYRWGWLSGDADEDDADESGCSVFTTVAEDWLWWRWRWKRAVRRVERECHFSAASPSQKLASAQRGWGFPRSSRTSDSSSAILFRSRVVSSMLGSSLCVRVQVRRWNSCSYRGMTYLAAGSSTS